MLFNKKITVSALPQNNLINLTNIILSLYLNCECLHSRYLLHKSWHKLTINPFQTIVLAVNAVILLLGLPPPTDTKATLVNFSESLKSFSKVDNYFSLNRFNGFSSERELEFAGKIIFTRHSM